MYRNLFIVLISLFVLVNAQNVSVAKNETNTTTSAPVPTTTSPTTTTVAPTTTTPKVTTTPPTPAPSTIPPTPAPIPEPKEWNGNVTDGNKTCISARFAIKIEVHYNSSENNTLLKTGFTIPVEASVGIGSHCSSATDSTEALVIDYSIKDLTSGNLSLVFNKTDVNVFVEEVRLFFDVTEKLFPQFDKTLYGHSVNADKVGLTLFKVAPVHSYVCNSPPAQPLETKTQGIVDVNIDFSSAKLEAYIDEKNEGKFDSEIDCKSTEISDVVPIAVGAALAGLVVIVLIAYFIGRRRSRRLAYQSV